MTSETRSLAVVVLAAGKGTRMESSLPKVLQPLMGKPMIQHLLQSVDRLNANPCVVVVGPDMGNVEQEVAPRPTVIQAHQLGTGDAVKAARESLQSFSGDVLVVYGDTPLISTQTLERLLAARRLPSNPAVVVLGFRPDDPAQYGRLLAGSDGDLQAIVEYLDCSEYLRSSNLCNSGVMAFDAEHLFDLLDSISNHNSKGEYYLTDVISIARDKGLNCAFIEGDPQEVLGINTKAELAEVEAAFANA